MKSVRVVAAVAGTWILAANACGGTTRFVVVQPGGGAAAPSAPVTTAAPAGADDDAAVREVLASVLSLDAAVTFADRVALIEGGEDLEPTYQALLDLVADLDVETIVDAVTVAGDTATATVTVKVGGADFAAGVPVELVRTPDGWRVTRGGACAVISLGVPCPEG